MEYTTNKKYKKPDLLDKVSVQEYNENFDAMDANMAELEEKTSTAVKNASDALKQIEAAGGKVMTSDTLGVGKVDGKTVGVTEDGTLSVIAKASDIPATDSNNILGNDVSPTTQALIDAIANKVVNELVTNTALTSTLANYMTKSLMSSQNADNTDMVPTLALTNAMQKSIDTLNSKTSKTGHIHDDRYYTESEIEAKFNQRMLIPSPTSSSGGISTYQIKPQIADQGILCICRSELYIVRLGQSGGAFNAYDLIQISDHAGTTNATASLTTDKKTLIFKCSQYENPIFIGRF